MEKGVFNRMDCPMKKGKKVYIPVNGTACDGCKDGSFEANIIEGEGPGKITGCRFSPILSPLERMKIINSRYENGEI
jgi:hypothetical protein